MFTNVRKLISLLCNIIESILIYGLLNMIALLTYISIKLYFWFSVFHSIEENNPYQLAGSLDGWFVFVFFLEKNIEIINKCTNTVCNCFQTSYLKTKLSVALLIQKKFVDEGVLISLTEIFLAYQKKYFLYFSKYFYKST